MMLLSSRLPHWKQALLIIQPETVLRWHRELFKWLWRRKSRHTGGKEPISDEVVALIKRMATENRLWGAKRIRGELLKLGPHVSKSVIQKYMHQMQPPRASGQTWTTFLHNQAEAMWACDFIQITDVFFRSLFAFVIVELGSRRVVQLGVTRHPSDEWVAQQLRVATPFGQGPKYLIRDNDDKYGMRFANVARGYLSRSSPRLCRRHAPTPWWSASSARCGASVWTGCWFGVKPMCGVCCALMSRTSTPYDLIRA